MDNVVTEMRDLHQEVVLEWIRADSIYNVRGLTKFFVNEMVKGCPLDKERTGLLVKPPQGALLSRHRY